MAKALLVGAGTLVAAAILGLVANIASLNGPMLYSLGGAALAVCILFGTPYAFPQIAGPGADADSVSKDSKVVEPHEATVGAEQGFDTPPPADRERPLIVGRRLDQGLLYAGVPNRMSAHGTVATDALASEVRLEVVELTFSHA